MADKATFHVHNTDGLPSIEVGAHAFMCIGAKPPFDHPHVFLTFGDDAQKVCPYCSTLYTHSHALGANEANPADCAWNDDEAVTA